jgi:hypothetical protein
LWAGRRRERVVWRETDDGQKAVNMRMVEWLSIEELGGGRHADDHYAVKAHLPSGESAELSAHRTPEEARDALKELIG